jgi:hypothetical protein
VHTEFECRDVVAALSPGAASGVPATRLPKRGRASHASLGLRQTIRLWKSGNAIASTLRLFTISLGTLLKFL